MTALRQRIPRRSFGDRNLLRSLLNPTWLCTNAPKPSPEPFFGNPEPSPELLFGNHLNLTWLKFLRTLLVEPGLALYQSLPNRRWNVLWNPGGLALQRSLPDLLRNFSGALLTFDLWGRSFPDLRWNLLRNPAEPDLAGHQACSPETSPESVEADLDLHQVSRTNGRIIGWKPHSLTLLGKLRLI